MKGSLRAIVVLDDLSPSREIAWYPGFTHHVGLGGTAVVVSHAAVHAPASTAWEDVLSGRARIAPIRVPSPGSRRKCLAKHASSKSAIFSADALEKYRGTDGSRSG